MIERLCFVSELKTAVTTPEKRPIKIQALIREGIDTININFPSSIISDDTNPVNIPGVLLVYV